jgi:hypothetical protein
MDNPPYSPDLDPCNFWLFPKLKNALKGQSFADLSDNQRNVKTLLRGIPENDFQDLFNSGTIVSLSAQLHKESILKATAAASGQVRKFYFHRAIPGIKLSHLVHTHYNKI